MVFGYFRKWEKALQAARSSSDIFSINFGLKNYSHSHNVFSFLCRCPWWPSRKKVAQWFARTLQHPRKTGLQWIGTTGIAVWTHSTADHWCGKSFKNSSDWPRDTIVNCAETILNIICHSVPGQSDESLLNCHTQNIPCSSFEFYGKYACFLKKELFSKIDGSM